MTTCLLFLRECLPIRNNCDDVSWTGTSRSFKSSETSLRKSGKDKFENVFKVVFFYKSKRINLSVKEFNTLHSKVTHWFWLTYSYRLSYSMVENTRHRYGEKVQFPDELQNIKKLVQTFFIFPFLGWASSC